MSPDAEMIVIEAAHRALIKKYHPDLWLQDPNAQGRAAAINEAFETLKDPESRSRCDRRLREMRNAIQAVAFQQQRPRPRGALWWSGWLVALILAGAQFVPWEEISLPAAQLASRSAPARVAAEAVAEVEAEAAAEKSTARHSSRSEKPLPASLVKLLDERQEREANFLRTLEARSEQAAASGDTQATPGSPAHRQPVRRRGDQRRKAMPQQSQPADFLEREGYIY